MRLKAACWACAILTFFLLVGWPSFVGLPPKKSTRAQLKAYAVKTEIYFAGLMLSFIGTTVFAALVVRQTRREVQEQTAENLRMLIEGTLQDHRKKSESDKQQD